MSVSVDNKVLVMVMTCIWVGIHIFISLMMFISLKCSKGEGKTTYYYKRFARMCLVGTNVSTHIKIYIKVEK